MVSTPYHHIYVILLAMGGAVPRKADPRSGVITGIQFGVQGMTPGHCIQENIAGGARSREVL